MASFLEDLWNSIFVPGPTPTLLIATNASFAALQFVLLVLLIATYSIHFLILSVLSGGLWFSINWFVRELQTAQATAQRDASRERTREKSPDLGSETETEDAAPAIRSAQEPVQDTAQAQSLRPPPSEAADTLRKRRSLGDSSGYVSTDSEWEKVSEGDEKNN